MSTTSLIEVVLKSIEEQTQVLPKATKNKQKQHAEFATPKGTTLPRPSCPNSPSSTC